MRATSEIASTILPSSAFSTNEREVRTSATCAAWQAATRLWGPAVKLSIAGTRPAACSAMNVTAEPLAFGSRRPTISPGAVIASILRASTPTPMRNMRSVRAPASEFFHRDARQPALLCLLLEHRMQRLADVRRLEDDVRHHVAQRGARSMPKRPATQAGRYSEATRWQDGDCNLGKEPPSDVLGVEAREEGALGPDEAHRSHRRATLLDHQPCAFVIAQHGTRDRDAPLRKDRQRPAGARFSDKRARRQRLRWIGRNDAREPQQGSDPPMLRETEVDREQGRLLHNREQDRRIEDGDVIDGDDSPLARSREVLDSLDLEAEQRAPQQAKEEREEVRRQPAKEIERGCDVGEAEHDQRHRLGEAEQLQEEHGRERAGDHHDVVQRIDRADDSRAPILPRPCLDRGEERNDEQARGGGIEEQLEGDAQAESAHKEFHERNFAARPRHRVGRKPEVDRQGRDDEQKERRRRKLDASARQHGGAERSGGDPESENEIDRDFDVDPAADLGLDDHRHERKRDDPNRPEPACGERGHPLAIIGADFPNDPPGRGDDVPVDFEAGRPDAGRRDETRGPVAGESNDHQLRNDARGRTAFGCSETADDQSADDRGERRALDQRVGCNEFLPSQVIGQDAVFDRPEKGRDATQSEQRHIEQDRRGKDEARRSDHLDADLGELEPPRDQGLVVRIGDLAAQRGQGDRGQDERH